VVGKHKKKKNTRSKSKKGTGKRSKKKSTHSKKEDTRNKPAKSKKGSKNNPLKLYGNPFFVALGDALRAKKKRFANIPQLPDFERYTYVLDETTSIKQTKLVDWNAAVRKEPEARIFLAFANFMRTEPWPYVLYVHSRRDIVYGEKPLWELMLMLYVYLKSETRIDKDTGEPLQLYTLNDVYGYVEDFMRLLDRIEKTGDYRFQSGAKQLREFIPFYKSLGPNRKARVRRVLKRFVKLYSTPYSQITF
jgi:hypothetical protein